MNLINKKNMEENMNDMHGEETPRTDLTLFFREDAGTEKPDRFRYCGAGTYCRFGVDSYFG